MLHPTLTLSIVLAVTRDKEWNVNGWPIQASVWLEWAVALFVGQEKYGGGEGS